MLTFGTHEITTAMKCAALASTEGNLTKNYSNNCAHGRKWYLQLCPWHKWYLPGFPQLLGDQRRFCRLEYVSTFHNKCLTAPVEL
jgi:hypothetical protein